MEGRLRVAVTRRSGGAAGRADLELLATSAYMLGREDEWLKLMERACHPTPEAGEQRLAARCAFWIGMHLALRGQMGPGTGWLGRAGRLLEGEGDCVEQGYMLMPVMFQHEAEGDFDGAAATAAAAAEIGERFADGDLFSLAMFGQGDILVTGGRAGGPRPPRRGHGGRDDGRALADRHRDRLLRRDHDLRGGLRRAPGAGMDGRPGRWWSSSPTCWRSPAAASSTALS